MSFDTQYQTKQDAMKFNYWEKNSKFFLSLTFLSKKKILSSTFLYSQLFSNDLYYYSGNIF